MDYLHLSLLMFLAFAGGMAIGYLAGRKRLSLLIFLAIPWLLTGLIIGYLANYFPQLLKVIGGVLGALLALALLMLIALALTFIVVALIVLRRLLHG
ncbi:MAG: hypothetical protein N3E36_04205 [Sulfolobales archaeon]|nr:hypothetical protein [Sulfolobales archaeon]